MWNENHREAFFKIKESISSKYKVIILVHYNPDWELVVASDASPFGI